MVMSDRDWLGQYVDIPRGTNACRYVQLMPTPNHQANILLGSIHFNSGSHDDKDAFFKVENIKMLGRNYTFDLEDVFTDFLFFFLHIQLRYILYMIDL
jgi:hypothetical protein